MRHMYVNPSSPYDELTSLSKLWRICDILANNLGRIDDFRKHLKPAKLRKMTLNQKTQLIEFLACAYPPHYNILIRWDRVRTSPPASLHTIVSSTSGAHANSSLVLGICALLPIYVHTKSSPSSYANNGVNSCEKIKPIYSVLISMHTTPWYTYRNAIILYILNRP